MVSGSDIGARWYPTRGASPAAKRGRVENRSRSDRAGELADFYAGFGDGVEAFGLGGLVALEEAVDRVVLFDVAAGELEEDDRALEVDVVLEGGVGDFGVGGGEGGVGLFGGVVGGVLWGGGGQGGGVGGG